MYLSSLSNAPGSSVLVEAVRWLQGTLLGTVATTVAIIAIAWVRMLMLAGRLEIRRGLTTVAGCFILFGATSIVAGIQATAASEPGEIAALPSPLAMPEVPPPRRNADPYAGAALPTR